jgi:hypothetical protein
VSAELPVVVRADVACPRSGPAPHAVSTNITATRQAARRTAGGYPALADAWFESGPVPTPLVAATS